MAYTIPRNKAKEIARPQTNTIPVYLLARKNEEAGKYWYSKDTMRFFRTKLPEKAYVKGNYAYFVSGETNPSGETKYSIRRQNLTTQDVNTIGEFHSYETRQKAQKDVDTILKFGKYYDSKQAKYIEVET